jgi:hypothetical protein
MTWWEMLSVACRDASQDSMFTVELQEEEGSVETATAFSPGPDEFISLHITFYIHLNAFLFTRKASY